MPSPSLRSLLPTLAPIFNLTTDALYERQRALVRTGLLPAPQGRGRGAGAEATPDNVAMLVIAVMATDRFADTEGVIEKLANAPCVGQKKGRCPFTGAANFKDALAFILSSKAPASTPKNTIETVVRVFRADDPSAHILFDRWPKSEPDGTFVHFGTRENDLPKSCFFVGSILPSGAVQEIRSALGGSEAAK